MANSDSSTKLGEQSWIRLSMVGALLGGTAALYTKFGQIETRTAVLEANSTHANRSLDEIAQTLREISAKQDGEREAIGQHGARIQMLETRVSTLEGRQGK